MSLVATNTVNNTMVWPQKNSLYPSSSTVVNLVHAAKEDRLGKNQRGQETVRATLGLETPARLQSRVIHWDELMLTLINEEVVPCNVRQQPFMPRLLLDADWVASILGCTVSEVYGQVRQGALPTPIRIGGVELWPYSLLRKRTGISIGEEQHC